MLSFKKNICVLSLFLFVVKGFSIEPKDYLSVQEYYNFATKAYKDQQWENLHSFSNAIRDVYPKSPFAKDAIYYQAVANFHLIEYERSNELLSEYLNDNVSPKFFKKAFSYKFEVAENFRNGAKKRLFGIKRKSPKWLDATEDALKIYEEIIHVLPQDDLAAKSLFGKAVIHLSYEEYPESIECLQQIIRTFPKHPLAIESFLQIQKTYFKQVSPQRQESDLLDLAKLNIKKFKEAFPNEEKIKETEQMYLGMKEIYATGLYKIGEFFERTKKPKASEIYYKKIIKVFPETKASLLSRKRLDYFHKKNIL